MDGILRIEYLFTDFTKFPWDILGIYVPRVGSAHSYLTRILAEFGPEDYREFMRSSPSMREIRRASEEASDPLLADIYIYCNKLYEKSPSDRDDVAQEVLNYLNIHTGFKKKVQKRLDELYIQNLISVPDRIAPAWGYK